MAVASPHRGGCAGGRERLSPARRNRAWSLRRSNADGSLGVQDPNRGRSRGAVGAFDSSYGSLYRRSSRPTRTERLAWAETFLFAAGVARKDHHLEARLGGDPGPFGGAHRA